MTYRPMLDGEPWTLYNGGQTLCLHCRRKISTKPGVACPEPRHVLVYGRNASQTATRRVEAQLQAFVHYSGYDPPCCVLCGYGNTIALQLDHIDGSGAAFRRANRHQSGKSLALWLRLRGWPDGYRVLCANCQCLERDRLGHDGRRRSE